VIRATLPVSGRTRFSRRLASGSDPEDGRRLERAKGSAAALDTPLTFQRCSASRGFPRPGTRPDTETRPRAQAQCLPCPCRRPLDIVGESHRQDELRALSKRTTDASPFREDLVDYAADVADSEPDRRWFMAVLVREPDNPADAEAIAVHAQGGGLLGYLKREDARRYGRVFESFEKRGSSTATWSGSGAGTSRPRLRSACRRGRARGVRSGPLHDRARS
jgi:hypothetical protein